MEQVGQFNCFSYRAVLNSLRPSAKCNLELPFETVGGLIQAQQNDWNTRLPILSGRKYPFLQVFP
jgi:hypothetical protein